MTLGTHNSATGGKLLWWLRPIGGIINLTSKCQDKSINEQLAEGVKLFNLQVAFVGGKWRFTHGLAVYKEDILETIAKMKACNSDTAFAQLVADIKKQFCCPYFVMLSAWVEGTDTYYDGTDCYTFPKWEEHYWTLDWSKIYGKTWIDKIPLPKRHARLHNAEYKKNCKNQYLMLDFYGLG